MENHPTKNCQESKIMFSQSAQEGHRGTYCRNRIFKCLKCNGQHMTLSMACPVKRKLTNRKKKMEKEQEQQMHLKRFKETKTKTNQLPKYIFFKSHTHTDKNNFKLK